MRALASSALREATLETAIRATRSTCFFPPPTSRHKRHRPDFIHRSTPAGWPGTRTGSGSAVPSRSHSVKGVLVSQIAS